MANVTPSRRCDRVFAELLDDKRYSKNKIRFVTLIISKVTGET